MSAFRKLGRAAYFPVCRRDPYWDDPLMRVVGIVVRNMPQFEVLMVLRFEGDAHAYDL